jgi:hypothetical protein
LPLLFPLPLASPSTASRTFLADARCPTDSLEPRFLMTTLVPALAPLLGVSPRFTVASTPLLAALLLLPTCLPTAAVSMAPLTMRVLVLDTAW